MTLGQRRVLYRGLVECMPDSTALAELERRLSAQSLNHKRSKVARTPRVRLLVAKGHYDIAFRVLLEFSAELAPGAFSAAASHSPAAGE